MTLSNRFRARLLALVWMGACLASGARAEPLPTEAFFAERPFRSVHLSPDGSAVAYLSGEKGRASVWIFDAATGDSMKLLEVTSAERLEWSSDSQWLFLVGTQTLSAIARDGRTSRVLTGLDAKTRQRFAGIDRSSVLITEQDDRSRLVRISLDGKRETLYDGKEKLLGFALDANGRLAFATLLRGDSQVISWRQNAGWKELRRCDSVTRCRLLGASADGERAWLATSLDGSLERLVELDGRTGQLRTLDSDRVDDLEAVVFDPVRARPAITSYVDGVRRNHALGPEYARHLAAIERRLGGHEAHVEIGRDRWLVAETSSTLQWPRYHLYTPASGALTPVLPSEAPLPEAALVPKTPFNWRANDGMTLHGYRVVPRGVDPRRVPLIVAVHGGPWGHVGTEFSSITQLLVNRGYAVFEPNFRGSTGYGRDYVLAARGDFGDGRVEQDIIEGTRALLKQGIGDPARVGIVGHSFGGYAALVGATLHPELFQVAVAGAPPTDFGWILRTMIDSEFTEDEANVPFRAQMKALSLDVDDPAQMGRLTAQSPERNAERLRRPVVVIAGAKDERVPIRSVTWYAARLRTLGKDVRLLVDPDSGHSMDGRLAREAYVHLIEETLHRALGGPAPAAPSPELRDYLQRNEQWRPVVSEK